jgi:hypothetical protein
MGREGQVDSWVNNIASSNWSCSIRFIACVLHLLIWLVIKLHFQILCKWIPIYSLFNKLYFKFSTNGFPYIFFAQELFCSNFLQIVTHVLFFQDFYEQVANPTHEQIKSIQSSIKSTQFWSSIKNSFLRTNPLPINPIVVRSKVNT